MGEISCSHSKRMIPNSGESATFIADSGKFPYSSESAISNREIARNRQKIADSRMPWTIGQGILPCLGHGEATFDEKRLRGKGARLCSSTTPFYTPPVRGGP
eukprot:m.456531 g.456531  ORF g.456531 m.456531 type:complete len:102 (-) comp21072_c0_seq1:559-864(-)